MMKMLLDGRSNFYELWKISMPRFDGNGLKWHETVNGLYMARFEGKIIITLSSLAVDLMVL